MTTAPTSPELEKLALKNKLPILDAAIESKSASFESLIEAHYFKEARFVDNPVTRLTYARYYPDVVKAFEAAHGRIVKFFTASMKCVLRFIHQIMKSTWSAP